MASNSRDRFNGYVSSLAIKAPCVVATTAAITLEGEQTIDGVAVTSKDRVLVKDQADTTENGIYIVQSSAWRRAPDWDGNRDASRRTVILVGNSAGDSVMYEQTSPAVVNNQIRIGTDPCTFAVFYDSSAPVGGFAVTAAETAEGITVTDTSWPEGYVKRYGAVGDGVTDDTTILQSVFDFGANQAVKIVFTKGTYIVEALTATTADDFHVCGEPGEKPVLKLRDDDTLGGLGLIFTGTDLLRVSMRNLKFDGNYANAKAGNISNRLVNLKQTSAMGGIDGATVFMSDIDFEESAKGYGHLSIGAYEEAGSNYGWLQKVTLHRMRHLYSGNNGYTIFLRGHIKDVDINGVYARNDGQYGFEATGTATYAGSSSYAIHMSAEITYGRYIENVSVSNLVAYRVTGAIFYQMVRSHKTKNVTVDEVCINPYYDIAPAAITSVDAGTDRITSTVAPGYGNDSVVRFTTTGTLPSPLVPNALYYTRDLSGSTFKLSNYSGGPAINITDVGTGTHSIEWLGLTYTTSIKEDDNNYDDDRAGNHVYENVTIKNNTPHSVSRDFSVEETTANTATPVRIKNCSFTDNVSLTDGYPDVFHHIKNTSFNIGNNDYTYASGGKQGSHLTIGRGTIEGCRFRTNTLSIIVKGALTIRDCHLDSGLTWSYTSSAPNTDLTIENTKLNYNDVAIAGLQVAATTTGTEHIVRLKNVGPAPGNTFGVELQILATTDHSLFKYYIDECDIGLASFSDADHVDARLIANNNRVMRRASTRFPLTTFANAGVVTQTGGSVFKTGGTVPITNFAGSIGFEKITVYVESGHTISNSANIQTVLGEDITGEAVAEFIRKGTVWHQVGGGPVNQSSAFLSEQAAAKADVAGLGQFWVRDDTPNTPMFTDDAGTDSELLRSGETVLSSILQDYAIECDQQGLVTDANQTLTYSDGPVFELDLENWTANRTITISGGPPASTHGQVTVKITQDGTAARTITWAGGTFVWANGTEKVLNTTLDGVTIFTFETWDAGATWHGSGVDYS